MILWLLNWCKRKQATVTCRVEISWSHFALPMWRLLPDDEAMERMDDADLAWLLSKPESYQDLDEDIDALLSSSVDDIGSITLLRCFRAALTMYTQRHWCFAFEQR